MKDDEKLQAAVEGRDVARALSDDAFLARFLRPRLGLVQVEQPVALLHILMIKVFDSLMKCLQWRSDAKVFELAGTT